MTNKKNLHSVESGAVQNIQKHSVTEDALAMIQATIVFSIGVIFFNESNIISGGTTGLSLIMSYLTPYSIGYIYFMCNLPFIVFSFMSISKGLFFKTIIQTFMTSFFIEFLSSILTIDSSNRLLGAILGGTFCGIAILIAKRHESSFGGFTMLLGFIEKKYNINCGKFLLLLDGTLMVASAFFFDIETVVYSMVSVAIVSTILISNNKNRYFNEKQ